MVKTDLPALRVQYCKIMSEIKDRLRIIEGIYRAEFKLPSVYAFELYYLEIRMICELIALACLTAHGDMPAVQTSHIRTAYEPGKILTHLDRLHPKFFPVPVEEKLGAGGELSILPIRNGSLTRSELVKLHGYCGEILHRGAFDSFDSLLEPDFLKAAEWHHKIVRLLNRHLIALLDQKRLVYVVMQESTTNEVTLTDFAIRDASHWPNWFQELHSKVRTTP